MSRVALLTVGGLLLSCTTLVFAEDRSERSGDHFRVICHFKSDTVPAAALAIAEAVWPIADELYGAKAPHTGTPLEIHLYRTASDYEKAEAEITGGRFRSNLAFSSEERKAAHIAVQPECGEETLQAIGLTALTRRLIAHESAHLYRYATMPNYRDHPGWLADGAAAWIAEKALTHAGYSPAFEADPFLATYVVWVQRLIEAGQLPSIDAVLRDDLDAISAPTRYALRYLLFRFMASGDHRPAWQSALGEARRLGGGADYAKGLRAAVMSGLRAEARAALDAELKTYLAGLKPQWEEVYRSLEIRDDIWVQSAFLDTNAIAWRTAPVGKADYELRGDVRIVPGGHQQMNLLLDRNSDGFVSVAFVAGYGVTVFDYHAKDDRWERLGSAEITGLNAGSWIAFRLAVRGGQLAATVNGRGVLNVPLGGRSVAGPWGVGAQAGTAGLWRALRLEP